MRFSLSLSSYVQVAEKKVNEVASTTTTNDIKAKADDVSQLVTEKTAAAAKDADAKADGALSVRPVVLSRVLRSLCSLFSLTNRTRSRLLKTLARTCSTRLRLKRLRSRRHERPPLDSCSPTLCR